MVVAAVEVDERVAVGEFELAGLGVYVLVVGNDVDHLGDVHLMRAERHNLLHAALDAERGLLDGGGRDYGCLAGGEAHLLELVVVPARTYAAPVGGSRRGGIGEVDDKLHVALDDIGRVALGAYGDVAHRWVGTDGTGPRYGNDVVLLLRGAARYHDGRKRVDHRAGLPVDFHGLGAMG